MATTAVTANGLMVARIVRQVFAPQDWLTMIAIADVESTFDPTVVSVAGAVGLWQIDLPAHGAYIAQHYGVSGYAAQLAWLKVPINNAHIAKYLVDAVGFAPWTGDGYPNYLGVAGTLLARSAPTAPAGLPVVEDPRFAVTGTAHVSPGGLVTATLRLKGVGGAIPYTVTLGVGPSGQAPVVQTAKSGTVPANRTVTVTQTIPAPLLPPEVLRTQRGPVTFAYDIQWTVTDRRTGSHMTIRGPQRVLLTVS